MRTIKNLSIIIIILIAVLGLWMVFWHKGPEALVVYCAHDSVYSEKVLKAFEQETGIPLIIKFDTESTKSLGLIELLIQEQKQPRCDVFWNNELLGMLRLQSEGVLAPYTGTGYERIPSAFKDPEGFWAGFGARLRVVIYNTDSTDAAEAAGLITEAPEVFAIAKPLYGTTLTHFAVLQAEWGIDRLQRWFQDFRESGGKIVNGNGASRDAVAAGACRAGYTDTDDFYGALDKGKPVAFLPVQLEDGATICIPNTVALIKGAPHPEHAHKLIDYLLSETVEIQLANCGSRQIPLGPVDQEQIPEEVRELYPLAAKGYSLTGITGVYTSCLEWLKKEGGF